MNWVEIPEELNAQGEKCADHCATGTVSISDELAEFLMRWDNLSESVQQAVQALVSTVRPERPQAVDRPAPLFERHLTI